MSQDFGPSKHSVTIDLGRLQPRVNVTPSPILTKPLVVKEFDQRSIETLTQTHQYATHTTTEPTDVTSNVELCMGKTFILIQTGHIVEMFPLHEAGLPALSQQVL